MPNDDFNTPNIIAMERGNEIAAYLVSIKKAGNLIPITKQPQLSQRI
ncbi:hypothetical protein [Snodgrassella alvi]